MRLYVGGLPYETTEQDLLDLFGPVGHVTDASVIADRDTGRSKGFGFVEMNDATEAQAAITKLNGTLLGNRNITVNEARDRQSPSNRGSQGRDSRPNRNERY